MSRPLKLKRQYNKNIGRKIEVTTLDGKVRTGTLTATDDKEVTIEEKVRVKEGKKTKTELVKTGIAFDEIKKAIIKITF